MCKAANAEPVALAADPAAKGEHFARLSGPAAAVCKQSLKLHSSISRSCPGMLPALITIFFLLLHSA